MKMKKLGSTNLKIPPIIFGGNVLGWTLDERASFKLLDRVFDAGFTAIDTADSYSHWAPGNSGGESENILGKWMKDRGNRTDVMLATKVGSNPGQEGRNVSKAYIIKAAEDSLRRLKTDHIDLYFTHWDNEMTPVEETLEAYGELIKAGKVRHIGASNISAERLTASLQAAQDHALPKYEVLQPEYSLIARSKFEKNYINICKEFGIGVISYFSLASGFLTGKYRSKDDLKGAREGMVKNYFNEKGFEVLKALDEISQEHEVTNAAVALRWIIQRPQISAPIASVTKESHLRSFKEAADMELSEEEMNRLNEVSLQA